ncbi:MAG: tetratricopeptide repeat protein [Acidobacteriota bacterium]
MAVVIALTGSWGCAASVAPPAVPSAPAYVDYLFPQPLGQQTDQRLTAQHRLAWGRLQRGDLGGANADYSALVRHAPGYVPAEVGLGYVLLAQRQIKDALAWFEHAVRLAPSYASAYAGRAEAYLALGQPDQALVNFEAALKIDPSLSELGRRADVIRFARVQTLIAAGRRAADEGRLEESRRAYLDAVRAAPDSAVLYRDLGGVELRLNAMADAVAHLRKAVALDAGDARAFKTLGDALEKQGDVVGAIDAYQQAVALDGGEGARQALDRLRDRAASTRLPADYAAIARLAQVTRGDVAALLGVRLPAVLSAAGRRYPPVVATDVRGHWAAAWIATVTRSKVMEVYANHAFQPAAVVKRADMAQVVARVLMAAAPGVGRATMRPTIPDVPGDHLSYPDVAVAVSSGVMGLVDGGVFRPSRVLSGAEAIDVMDRLERIAKSPRTGTAGGTR